LVTKAAAANSRSNIELQLLVDEVVVYTAVPNSLLQSYQYTQPVQYVWRTNITD
jgi:hypothetical protein